MTPPLEFILVSQSSSITTDTLKVWASALQAQMDEDFYPVWGRSATFEVLQPEDVLPQGKSPIFILDQLDEPGALGYHTDSHGQPVAYVQAQGEQTPITISHEAIESVVDPSGNRFSQPRTVGSFGRCQILLEACDPPEAASYYKGGVLVSDFVFPEWYDQNYTPGQQYTFLKTIDKPLVISQGGYFSFVDRHGNWHQETFFNSSPEFTTLGRKSDRSVSCREWIDLKTRKRR